MIGGRHINNKRTSNRNILGSARSDERRKFLFSQLEMTLLAVVSSFLYRLHGDLTLALTRCSCSALREVAVFVRKCGKCKPLYASVIERCVTLPVSTWSVARKQSFRFVGGHVHNVTTSHFERKKTKFFSNKRAIYRRNRSSVCLLFVKLALLCVFCSFIRPITYTRASQDPLEAILVIFGRRALIFFCLKALGKK